MSASFNELRISKCHMSAQVVELPREDPTRALLFFAAVPNLQVLILSAAMYLAMLVRHESCCMLFILSMVHLGHTACKISIGSPCVRHLQAGSPIVQCKALRLHCFQRAR